MNSEDKELNISELLKKVTNFQRIKTKIEPSGNPE